MRRAAQVKWASRNGRTPPTSIPSMYSSILRNTVGLRQANHENIELEEKKSQLHERQKNLYAL